MKTKSILLLSAFLLMTPKLIFAHGDGHVKEQNAPALTKETDPLNDSIYSVGINKEDTDLSFMDKSSQDTPFSSINILGEDSSLMGRTKISEPMKRFEEKKNLQKQHDKHKDEHVEEALHEWVSPNSKGYKVAISITIISGLSFIGLSFFRIGEKS